ncbi:MAG TPA: hypothetical protein VFJ52_03595 [Terriglobia bacterium]|nr:hypothetical protein [Terriglobia bacterium]
MGRRNSAPPFRLYRVAFSSIIIQNSQVDSVDQELILNARNSSR